ncbi:hypothetical protein HPP92_003817 [Vanilla planifolia]|uniref:Uncharacterized protein n=1 Tax=Vanilla planifolia TaxID=51239 RepID=A0A835SB52_VANPL|nr:hypothetical protein HPP92_003817 [Vanilla planifolia]
MPPCVVLQKKWLLLTNTFVLRRRRFASSLLRNRHPHYGVSSRKEAPPRAWEIEQRRGC